MAVDSAPSFSIMLPSSVAEPGADPRGRSSHPPLCNMTMEELLSLHEKYEVYHDTRLTPMSQCPACRHMVANHRRVPSSSPLLPASPPSGVSSPSSVVGRVPSASAVHGGDTSHLYKYISLLPKWNKDSSTCVEFLSSIERTLSISPAPKNTWYRILPLLFPTADTASAKWVQAHIVDAAPSTWSEACGLFTQHFQRADYHQMLERKYGQCRHLPKETVQEYGDKFLSLCEELAIDDDSPLAISHFINHLSERMRSKYNNMVAVLRLSGGAGFTSSLRLVIKTCTELDIADGTSEHRSSSAGPSSSSSTHPASNKKHCKYHPTSSSHSTNECSLHGRATQSGGHIKPSYASTSSHSKPLTSYSSSSHGQKSSGNAAGVTCYSCGGAGHYKGDTRCPHYVKPQQGAPFSSPVAARAGSASSFQGKTSGRLQGTMMVSVPRQTDVTSKPTVDFEPEEKSAPKLCAVPVSSSSCGSSVDRTLPLVSMISKQRDEVFFFVKNRLCRTLLDSGSDISIIDKELAEELGLESTPSHGPDLQLAVKGATAPRGAKTTPISVLAVYHCPSSAGDQVGSSENSLSFPPQSFSASFEIMPFPSMDAQFLVGLDLLPFLFPKDNLPLRFVRRGISSAVVNTAGCTRGLLGDVPTVACVMPVVTTEPTCTTVAAVAGTGDPMSLVAMVDRSQASGDAASVDTDPSPGEVGTFTPASMEQEYASHRERLLSDRDIQDALRRNSVISGFCNLAESTLRLEVKQGVDPSSLRRRQYRVAQQLIPRVDVVVQRWFSEGKIRPAPPGCAYNNPLVVAPKKDDAGNLVDIRVCLDTRALNEVLVTEDSFQLPYIRAALEIFGGCKIFGEFDLSEAYLQFKVAEESQPLTAFTWQGKQFVFVGCPFGLSVLPSHFQRVMSYVFQDLPFTFPYMDNMPFGSSTWEQHRDHALIIIERLNGCNLKIKPASVKFGHSHIRCLGHLISSDGVGMDPKKLQALKDWPLPVTGPQLQTFLGFVTFLRQHVRHFAELTGPLEAVKLLKDIVWTDALKECFHATKDALQRAPFLQYPDYSRPFHIATDASNTGVGGVLYQPRTPDEQVTSDNIVAICSKKLSVSQRNYSAYKKELWGIVYCLRQFRPYVWGRQDLVIVTDHKPLTYLLSTTDASQALQLWLDDILDFSFQVVHRPGVLNVLPDALSRMYSGLYPMVWGVPAPGTSVSSSHIVFLTPGSDTSPMVAPVSLSFEGEGKVDSSLDSTLAQPTTTSSDMSAMDMMVEMEHRGMTIPPIAQRMELVRSEHLFGHFGREAIYRSLYNKKLWWPKMRMDIQSVIADCDACNRFVVVKAGYDPAQFIHASGPWDHIQVDTSVHLPASPDGYTALMVVIDVFTGYIVLRPLKSNTAEAVARKLWKIFCTLGLPKIIQSDNGSEYVNDTLRALVKITGLDHRLISPYNPRADGKVERSIGSVMQIIKKLLHGSEKHWPLFVPFAQLSFNRKVTNLTGSSPFSLMFGRAPNEIKDYSHEPATEISLDDWKSHQEKIVSLIYPGIGDRILRSKDKMIQTLNKHRHTLLSEKIPAGATVMLKDPVRKDKFEPKYIGPYTVVRRSHNGRFVLKDATGDLLDRHVPIDQLKIISRAARRKDASGDVFEVKDVIDHRGEPGHYEYLTRWKGYADDEATWEPAASFLDDGCIRSYWKKKKTAMVARPANL